MKAIGLLDLNVVCFFFFCFFFFFFFFFCFFFFFIGSIWELMTPDRDGAIFDLRGMVGRIYTDYHYTLLHTKYESSGLCSFL